MLEGIYHIVDCINIFMEKYPSLDGYFSMFVMAQLHEVPVMGSGIEAFCLRGVFSFIIEYTRIFSKRLILKKNRLCR